MAPLISSFRVMLSPPAIVAIVLMAFLYAGYHEWVKARSNAAPNGAYKDLSATLQSLDERLSRLEQERDALAERVQNLETIVTSEAWIARHDRGQNAEELPSSEAEELALPPDDVTDSDSVAEHTAELARRLRSNDVNNGNL